MLTGTALSVFFVPVFFVVVRGILSSRAASARTACTGTNSTGRPRPRELTDEPIPARCRGARDRRNNRDLPIVVRNIEQARAPSGEGSKTASSAGLDFGTWDLDFLGRVASLSQASSGGAAAANTLHPVARSVRPAESSQKSRVFHPRLPVAR